MTRYNLAAFVVMFTLSCSAPVSAQVKNEVPPVVPGAKPVAVERIKIHGKSLEGNLEGDEVDRDALVFLPSSYATDKKRHYPVVYALHGYSVGANQWSQEIHAPQTIEGALALGSKDMIVVLPDSKTLHLGSMYSTSVTTGDFESYVAHDVVAYIDAHYRTIPERTSRGLVGHSMGGYGATRIGMKHPEVFGSLYIMSPCCLSVRGFGPSSAASSTTTAAATNSSADAARPATNAAAPNRPPSGIQLAEAAAWSPNPKNPPSYSDLPIKDGEPQAEVMAKWTANAPLALVDQYIPNLRQYKAIAMDVGDQDGLRVDAAKLHDVFDKYELKNTFEIYHGTHTSVMGDRFQNHVMPFFSQTLCFTAGCK